MDASNIIKPALSRGELQCVGATTLNEYRKYIEKDAALERRFQQVKVEAPSVEDTIKILAGIRHKYEAHHKAKHHRRSHQGRRRISATATSPDVSCPTRQSTSWTRPVRAPAFPR